MRLFFILSLVFGCFVSSPSVAESASTPPAQQSTVEDDFYSQLLPLEESLKGHTEEEKAKIIKTYKIFAHNIKAGNGSAMFYLAIFLEEEKRFKLADKLLAMSAAVGHPKALEAVKPKPPGYEAGLHYMHRGYRQKAYENFRIDAQKGHPESQLNLGILYDQDGDNATAMEWYKKSAALGMPTAQAILDMTEKYE